MTVIYLTSGSTWTVPSDCNLAVVECWGGGQAGDQGGDGSGGKGATYAKKSNISLTPGASIPIAVGAGGTTTKQVGGDTTFNTNVVIAPGGGSATAAVGDVSKAGGAGGGAAGPNGKSGGGAAGGPLGAGGAGATSGAAGNSGGGGGGGADNGVSGAAGTAPTGGNGGAGGQPGSVGGAGAASGAGSGGTVGGGGGGGGGGPLINTANGNNTGATATTVATSAGINVTAGNLLVVFVRSNGAVITCNSVTDTAGNTFTKLTTNGCPAVGNNTLSAFYAKNCLGNASNVFTANFSAADNFTSILALQYINADTSAPLDQFIGSFETSTLQNSFTTGTITTTQANEIIVAGFTEANTGAAFTAGTGGYKIQVSDPSPFSAVEDQIVNSTQTNLSASMSSSLSQTWEAILISFKLTTAALRGGGGVGGDDKDNGGGGAGGDVLGTTTGNGGFPGGGGAGAGPFSTAPSLGGNGQIKITYTPFSSTTYPAGQSIFRLASNPWR